MILLVKSSLVVILLLVFYKLFLQKESFFAANRMYLLGCLVLACILPFVVLPKMIQNQGYVDNLFNKNIIVNKDISKPVKHISGFDNDIDTESSNDSNLLENNIVLTNNVSAKKSLPTIQESQVLGNSKDFTSRGLSFYLFILYLFGVIILTINLLAQVGNVILKIIRNSDKIHDDGTIIVNMAGVVEPCSFFNYIFINPGTYDFDTYEQIIAHEKVHVSKKHSIDLLLSEISIIILWFNPFVWLMRREVEKNIEYQTDETLLQDEADIKEIYQLNLVKIACNTSPLAITTNYNQSLIKQRIIRMNSKRSNKFSYWKYAFCLPLVFILLLVLNRPVDGNAQPSHEVIDLPIITIQQENLDDKAELENGGVPGTIENAIPNQEQASTKKKIATDIKKNPTNIKKVPVDVQPKILDSKLIADCEEFENAVAAGDLAKVKEILKILDPDCLKLKINEKSNLKAVENLVNEKKSELNQKKKKKSSEIKHNELDICDQLKTAVQERNINATKEILQNEDITCLSDINGGPSNDISLIKGLLSYNAKITIYNRSIININKISFEINIDDYEASYCKDPNYMKLAAAILYNKESAIRKILSKGGLTCPLNENGVRNDFIFIKELMKYSPVIENHNGQGVTVVGVGIKIDMDKFENGSNP